ncbi:MAG: hypoxanthine phosphoribosyltransferase [Armatimonadetes bacterium]|nr:hypoxanthine phosphoribosyltransferase [Armatimonadota bacterium]
MKEEEINKKINEIAEKINFDYQSKKVFIIVVLKGAMFFVADLIRKLKIPITLDFVSISSYGNSAATSGAVKILKDLEENIEGQDCIIVEDIVDTGLTLDYLIKILKLRNPLSIKVCSFLDKPSRRILEIEIDYKGFEIPDKFVVGYGLDFAEYYRNLPFIATLKKEVIKKNIDPLRR